MEICEDKNVLAVHNKYLVSGGEDKSHIVEKEMFDYMGSNVYDYTIDNKKIAEIGKTKTAIRSIWSRKSYDNLNTIIREKEIDLIIVQNFFPLISPSLFYVAEKNNVPTIQFLRNYRLLCPSADFFRNGEVCEKCLGKKFQYPSIKHKCYKNTALGSSTIASMNFIHKILGTWDDKVSLYIALTEFAKKKYIEGGLPKDKILIKPNFLYPDPGVGKHDGDYIIFVGRLSVEKGVRTLLKAWSKFKGSTNLIILGEGPLESEVREANQIDSRIQYKGNVSTEKVFYYLKRSKFMVFTSEWYEGMPRTLIEAFATGTPVVSSDIGSMSTMIKDGRNGIHYEPGNVNQLYRFISDLISNDQLRRKLGFQAREDYLESFTRSANLKFYKKVFDKVFDE